MQMNAWRAAFIFLVCITASISIPAIAATGPVAKVAIEKTANGPVLRVTVANEGSAPIALYRNALPWTDRPGSFYLRAFRLDPELTELPPRGKLHDLIGTIELKPGQAISGDIALRGRFDAIDRELSGGPIVILWIWLPRSANERYEPVTGSLILQH
jgi:hypothetical protein